MKIAGIGTIPSVLHRDVKLLERKGTEYFEKEWSDLNTGYKAPKLPLFQKQGQKFLAELYKDMDQPRPTPDRLIDLMGIVLKKLQLWSNAENVGKLSADADELRMVTSEQFSKNVFGTMDVVLERLRMWVDTPDYEKALKAMPLDYKS